MLRDAVRCLRQTLIFAGVPNDVYAAAVLLFGERYGAAPAADAVRAAQRKRAVSECRGSRAMRSRPCVTSYDVRRRRRFVYDYADILRLPSRAAIVADAAAARDAAPPRAAYGYVASTTSPMPSMPLLRR